MDAKDIITINAALDNMRQNAEMKTFAKKVLTEENYIRLIKSYNATFWLQLIGILSGFILPCLVAFIIIKDITALLFGAVFGVLWMCIWLPVSLFMPQTKIYRKFAKWFRKKHATIDELDVIFNA